VNVHVPRLTRRRFLRLLGQGAMLSALPASLLAEAPNLVTVSLLHTTDLHGHILPTTDYAGNPDLGGLARCATQIRRWRRANHDSILLDIGDVYQGTEVSLAARGGIMIRCLNALGYEGWVVGNHEFDWGMDDFTACVGASNMPVLSGNALVEGRAVGGAIDAAHPLSRIRPWLMKEAAGFRIAIIGLTTPALTSWLPPEDLPGFETLAPVESLRSILLEVNEQKPDAIILAGHMGLIRRDDEANQVGALTQEFPQLTACLGGHTHQNHPGEWVNHILYTQADHYGIYAGKLDLTFDRSSRRLVNRAATTVSMDHTIPLDPLVLSLTQKELGIAEQVLGREVGELTEPFGASLAFDRPGEQERLIGSAMLAALRREGVEIDAVAHGLFEKRATLPAGRKTVADIWTLLPYENQVVTVELSCADLITVAQELSTDRDLRPLMGLRVVGTGSGSKFVAKELRSRDGSPLPGKPTYRLALNSYDSQSAGGRLPQLAQLVQSPTSRRILHRITIRDAVIDFFLAREKVGRDSLLV
jgi:2',3'-cyclic-nucleotide 2'-phosphodiesterase/3'-nucleotidase